MLEFEGDRPAQNTFGFALKRQKKTEIVEIAKLQLWFVSPIYKNHGINFSKLPPEVNYKTITTENFLNGGKSV